MLYYFNPEQNGRVKALFQPKEGIIDGFLTTETIPEIPDFGEGFTAELYYIDNELVWKSAKIETEPMDPINETDAVHTDTDANAVAIA